MKQGGKKKMKLEGNQSDMFLKKISILEQRLETQSPDVIAKAKSYLDCFKAFGAVVESSFGLERKEGWSEDIDKFSQIYRSLGISVTPKVNIFLAIFS